MNLAELNRRKFLQLVLLIGAGALASCSRKENAYLIATEGTLPKSWLKVLPTPWSFKSIKVDKLEKTYKNSLTNSADLIALGDGWLNSFEANNLSKINNPDLTLNLDYQAKFFLDLHKRSLANCLLPVGVSPWVMLFRNGDPWLTEAREKWDILLDPRLEGKIVFPKSPRLIMSIADQIGNGNDLKQLRTQALTLDDQNASNWILSGEARVALLPMQQCMKSINRDPRLRIALPRMGSPLHWTILIRPKSGLEPLPESWVRKTWELPLMGKLLSEGWIPPLPHRNIKKTLEINGQSYYSKFLPQEEVWSNCWSLEKLDSSKQQQLELRWQNSAP